MFYHGIKVEYVYKDYPILSSRRSVSSKDERQLLDRKHLLDQFGIEPIHLLESSADYSRERCLTECLAFGDVVFEFDTLEDPIWQLSAHEIGVPILPLSNANSIYVLDYDKRMKELFPNIPFYLVSQQRDLKKNACFFQISTL